MTGWFLFSGETIKSEELDLPDVKPEFKGDKTVSQRQRNVLYVYWEQNGSKGTFDNFYKQKLEIYINSIKEKLE